MDGPDLLRNLQIKPGSKLRLIASPAEVRDVLSGLVVLAEDGTAYEAALAFCETPGAVREHVGPALSGLVEDGVLWFAYPKGPAAKEAGLGRDVGWEALKEVGYRGVRMIALDDTWTAKRVREISKVKSSR